MGTPVSLLCVNLLGHRIENNFLSHLGSEIKTLRGLDSGVSSDCQLPTNHVISVAAADSNIMLHSESDKPVIIIVGFCRSKTTESVNNADSVALSQSDRRPENTDFSTAQPTSEAIENLALFAQSENIAHFILPMDAERLRKALGGPNNCVFSPRYNGEA